jgi:hypothetical protein
MARETEHETFDPPIPAVPLGYEGGSSRREESPGLTIPNEYEQLPVLIAIQLSQFGAE